MANYRNAALLRLARDQACQNCGAEDGTTVAAHSNSHDPDHGNKGLSLKSHDIFHAHLCHRCHAWLDQGSGNDPTGRFASCDKWEMFDRAMHRTWLHLWRSGLVRTV